MNNQRLKAMLISIIAADLVPRIQRRFGITLTLDDIGDLLGAAVIGWHVLWAAVEGYFPPPLPRALEPGTPFVQPSPKENQK